jgi:uncharacterized protein with PQ loop repeat
MEPLITFHFTDIIGYIASLVVLVSFLMKNMRTLRMVNSVGCIIFIVYGVLDSSVPVILTNTVIAGINAYYLITSRE